MFSQYDPSIGPDIEPVEAPVDKESGELLAEDRVVPFTADEEAVVVDGMTMTLGCTLKVLRAGCSALGLSTRGGIKVFAKNGGTCESAGLTCCVWC